MSDDLPGVPIEHVGKVVYRKHESYCLDPRCFEEGPRHLHAPKLPRGRYVEATKDAYMCEDCGSMVLDRNVHDRSHSIQSSVAWTLAVLQTTHLAAHIHDRYDSDERINRRQFDNWSGDALAEVQAEIADSIKEQE